MGGDQPVGGTIVLCWVAQCLYAPLHWWHNAMPIEVAYMPPLPALYARLTNHPNHAHIYKPSFTNSGSWAKFQFQIQRDTNTSFNNGNVEQKIDIYGLHASVAAYFLPFK